MKGVCKWLYWTNVALLLMCALVFACTRLAVILIQASEASVPFRLETGFAAEQHLPIHYTGMYDVCLRITKLADGRRTLDPEDLMAATMGDRIVVDLELASRESGICAGSTAKPVFRGSTDAAYYLGVATVRLSRGNTYTLRGTSRTSMPELAPTSPSLVLMFSPSANKSFNVSVGVMSWLALRVGLISGVVFGIGAVNRFRRRKAGAQLAPRGLTR